MVLCWVCSVCMSTAIMPMNGPVLGLLCVHVERHEDIMFGLLLTLVVVGFLFEPNHWWCTLSTPMVTMKRRPVEHKLWNYDKLRKCLGCQSTEVDMRPVKTDFSYEQCSWLLDAQFWCGISTLLNYGTVYPQIGLILVHSVVFVVHCIT